jgi:DNA-binding IscR family transcriptional regulator
MLTKPTREITFREVIEVLDGELGMVQCLTDTFTGCVGFQACGMIRQKMMLAQSGIGDVLDDITFDQITMH